MPVVEVQYSSCDLMYSRDTLRILQELTFYIILVENSPLLSLYVLREEQNYSISE